MSNIAIYPASFDPFTNGHLNIVKKAAKIFDKVFVVISFNANKKRTYDISQMQCAIQAVLQNNDLTNCEVCTYNGLTAEFAKNHNATYIIRGLRNNMDYNYEENIAEVNKLINPNLECIYFRADNVGISSSMVKELISFNQNVSNYVPKEIAKIL